MNEGADDELTELIHELRKIQVDINHIEKRLRKISLHRTKEVDDTE